MVIEVSMKNINFDVAFVFYLQGIVANFVERNGEEDAAISSLHRCYLPAFSWRTVYLR